MQELKEQLARIDERQIAIAAQLAELDKKLFGNGQPGLLEKLDGRIKWLELKYWLAFGGASVLFYIWSRHV